MANECTRCGEVRMFRDRYGICDQCANDMPTDYYFWEATRGSGTPCSSYTSNKSEGKKCR